MTFNTIISIGISKQLSVKECKKVKILNAINAIRLVTIFFYTYHSIVSLSNPVPSLCWYWFSGVSIIAMFTLHYYKQYKLATTIFLLNISLNIYAFSYHLHIGKGIENYFMIIPVFAVLLFEKEWIQHLFFMFAISLFFIPQFILFPDFISAAPGAKFVLFIGFYLTIFLLKKLNIKQETSLEQQRNDAMEDKQIIENQNRELETIHQFQQRFFENIAHEIKTPLTIIKGNTQHLLKSENTLLSTELQHENIHQTSKIQGIVEDVLHLAKMNHGVFEVEKEFFDVSQSAERLFQSFESAFKQQEITYKFISISDNCVIWGSPIFIERCLNNLITNALKFTPKKGIIQLEIERIAGKITLKLHDTGIGVLESEKERIFERFYQSKNTLNDAGGIGIGLAFCKEMVLHHNGSIEAKNRKEGGATFEIRLPAVNTTLKITKQITTTDKHSTAAHILLVEDNVDMIPFIQRSLPEYIISVVNNGKEALELIEKKEFQLIITDYMMPIMNGLELIQSLKQNQHTIPVIMLTAKNEISAKLEVLRLGIDDYIQKPFNVEELVARVHNVIGNHTKKQQFYKDEQLDEKAIEDEDEFTQKLRLYIEDNCTRLNFGVNELADEFALSVSSLYRKIKLSTGMNTKEFITEARLNKAKTIYESENISLKELAEKVGYINYNHFGQLYYNRFGKKPQL